MWPWVAATSTGRSVRVATKSFRPLRPVMASMSRAFSRPSTKKQCTPDKSVIMVTPWGHWLAVKRSMQHLSFCEQK